MFPIALILQLLSLDLPAELSVLTSEIGARAARAAEMREAPADAQRAVYRPEERAVSNWRGEALQALEPRPLSALAVALQVGRPVVTRCVKLNNYWCIKRARWNGEIGADEEGHVGFESAERGADAAATLLRRYYLDFGRKSALDIVRRWAPAECRLSPGTGGSPMLLAVSGIANTLRARFLASRGLGRPAARTRVASSGRRTAARAPPAPRLRVSAVPLRPLPMLRAPEIAAGMGERKAPVSTTASTARRAVPQPRAARAVSTPARQPARAAPARPRTALAAAAPVAARASAPRPASACAPDEQRIQNYASRMVQGLGLQPGDDLNLFDREGRPLPNLPRVMLSMSAVEIGWLHASVALVDGAITRAFARIEADLAAKEAARGDHTE